MNKYYSALAFLFLIHSGLASQSTLDGVLAGISASNKTLRAEAQRGEAAAKELQTGIWLYDPEIDFDFMKGFPADAGNQSDLTVSQSFDFPTAYARRRDLAGLKTAQIAYESAALRQSVLLEAKLACLELVFLNRRKNELSRRLGDAEQFFAATQKRYDAMDATALDLNKARQQVLRMETAVRAVDVDISAQLAQLAELNGGQGIAFTDTLYPPLPDLPPLEELAGDFETADPVLNYYLAQKNTGDAEIALAKALTLPKMEAGYRYQGILGQNFHGVHLGLTVPLWENRNKVAHQQLQADYYSGLAEDRRNRNRQELVRHYQQYRDLRENLEQYSQAMGTLNTEELLKKSLEAGQITTLEYLLELSLLYESRDLVLELEKQCVETAAKLWKFQL